MYGYSGRATAAAKAQIQAVLAPLSRKTGVDDDRSLAQRQADALVDMAPLAADSAQAPAMGGTRGQVLVIREERQPDPTAGPASADPPCPPAHVDGIGPVPDATAALFECDADTAMIKRDPHSGRIWDVGQADGDPSPKQRKAVLARDRVCVGCGAAAARCQIHHIRWRRNGGGTYIDNLVLVCWSCHNGIHHLGWTIQGTGTTRFTINRRPTGNDRPAHPPPQL